MRRIQVKVTSMASAMLVVVLALAVLACEPNGTRCSPGDYVACPCPGQVKGFARCLPSGDDYTLCNCSGATPPGVVQLDAAPPGLDGAAAGDGDAAGDGGSTKLAFLSPCEKDEQCETGLCFVFNAKGPRCSKKCGTDADCPAPSPGCNLQGVCKTP